VLNRRRVSIIVATYNRGELLCENAESLLAQEYDSYEIIYVDDGSTDDSPSVLEALQDTHSGRLRVLRVENGGPGPARNAGAEAATGELLLITDDDTIAPSDWVEKMVSLYEASDCEVVSGGFRPFSMENRIERYLHHRMCVIFGDEAKEIHAAPMMSFMISKEHFAESGGFCDRRLPWGEDWELCLRMGDRGWVMRYDPSVWIVHHYQAKWEPAALRIREAGATGIYIRRLGKGWTGAYTIYSVLRFLMSPLWILRRYPLDLYFLALRMEAVFCGARVKAYLSGAGK